MFKVKEVNPTNVPTPEAGKVIIFAYNGEMYMKNSTGQSRVVSWPVRMLTITVTDQDATPIEDVEVTIGGVVAGVTDENGVFVKQDATAETFEYTLTHDDYRALAPVEVPAGYANVENDETLYLAERYLEILVTDSEDGPLSGVNVLIDDVSVGVTGVAGTLSVVITTEECELNLTKTGYEFTAETIAEGYVAVETTEVMTDQTERTLNILVTDSEAGPLSGVTVLIDDVSIGDTNESGVLSAAITVEECELNLTKVGYEFTAETVAAGFATVETTEVMTDQTERTLNILVTDSEAGPLSGVTVLIDDVSIGDTNESGILSAAITVEECELNLTKAGYEFTAETIAAGFATVDATEVMTDQTERKMTIAVKWAMHLPIDNAEVFAGAVSLGFTDIMGTLADVNVPVEEFTLEVVKASQTLLTETVVAGLDELNISRVLDLRPLTVTVDDGADPIIGASVLIDDVEIGITNGIGVLAVYITLAECELDLSKEGYYYESATIAAGTGAVVMTESMIPVRSLSLTVLDTQEPPQPINGASAVIGIKEIGISDENGVIETLIPLTETTVTISCSGYITDDLIILAGSTPVEETISLESDV